MRTSDRYTADSAEETTLGKLLRDNLDGPRIAADILNHFIPDFVPAETLRKITKRSE